MKIIASRLSAIVVMVCGPLIWTAPACAQQPLSFAGKKISVSIGFSPTGVGYDTYGRLLARHMPKYLPGAPTMVAENKPGSGSMTLANHLYNAAARDGTEISLIGRGVAMDPLLAGAASPAKFDATKFTWIGSMNNEVAGFFLRQGAPAATLQDVLAGKEVQVGSAGVGSDMQTFSEALNAVLKTKLNIISGYPGMNEIILAMQRSEVDGAVGYSWSTARVGSGPQLKSGEFKLIMQLALAKHPDLPDVPLVLDLVKSEEDKAIFNLIFARQAMGRPVVAPPGLDPRTVAALRKAFNDTLKDPEFLAEADKIGLEINHVSGEEVEALVKSLYALPKNIIARAQGILAK
jgi:tripartite-type tricarboxylate transporter receptor subunit TctC